MNARKIAERMADAHLANSPAVVKSAGFRDSLIRNYLPVAEAALIAVSALEKAAERHEAAVTRRLDRNAARLDSMGVLLSPVVPDNKSNGHFKPANYGSPN